MRRVFFTIISILNLILFSIVSRAQPAASKITTQPPRPTQETENKIKPYKEWKTEMIENARLRVSASKINLDAYKATIPPRSTASKTEAGLDPQLERAMDQMQADDSYLTFTKDLSVSDYFVGYLVKQKNPQAAFKEAALKLTPEEVAELLNAYATHISESNSVGSPAPDKDSKGKIPKSASDQLPL